VSISIVEVSVRGVRSPVLTAGPPDGAEAVVFVHGNPGSADDWRELLSRAGELGRAIAPDMPGYGHASKPKDFSYSVDGYAAHLAALLDQLGITRAHVVAHDFGGPWALGWAARHPGALASATLINTGVLIGYRWHRYARIWRMPGLGEVFQATTSRPAFRLLLGRENPRLTREHIDRIYDASRSWATKRAVLKLYRATPAAALARPAAAAGPSRAGDLGDRRRIPALRTGRAPAPGVSVSRGRTAQRPWPLGDARRPRARRLPGDPVPHPAAARPRDRDRTTRQPAAGFVTPWPPPGQRVRAESFSVPHLRPRWPSGLVSIAAVSARCSRWPQVTRRRAVARGCEGLRLSRCGPARRRPLWADSSYRDAPAT